MADKKISQLNAAATIYDADDFAVVQDGETKQANASVVKTYVKDGLSKSDVGLGNVDNTSDANKPISTATQTAVNLKANASTTLENTDIGTAPNEVPLNQYLGDLAYQNEDQFVIRPQTSAHPLGIGEMTFQLTNNTTLVVKVKGTDGTVRSNTLTLE
jgi:hypothetical protein